MAGIKEVKYLAVHCSATQAKSDIGAKEIDRMHRQRGFLKIGYHFVIRRDGTIEKGRAFPDEIGAHVEGFNAVSCGICMIGGINANGKSEDNFTDHQYHSLALLLIDLHEKFPKAVIQGHRDFPNVNKDCPCFDVKKWWKDTCEVTDTSDPILRAELCSLVKEKK
jgi:N-acetyl-anhydromuramyl-L-alanine amidase AmpD